MMSVAYFVRKSDSVGAVLRSRGSSLYTFCRQYGGWTQMKSNGPMPS